MEKFAPKLHTVLALIIGLSTATAAQADEAYAKTLLKKMSDYMSAQKNISFNYDTILEVVTKDKQRLALAGSGTLALTRPDKLRSTRASGFADLEMVFDGKTLTLLGKGKNIYTQVEVPGTLDDLFDTLRDKYNRPLPGADLLMSNPQDQLMAGVTDIKDLGSGVIGGTECDHLAFRKKEVDWQIWIAQGDKPYPCRYSITSKTIAGSPQYSIQLSDFKSGDAAPADDFAFNNSSNAQKIDLKDLPNAEDLPGNFVRGKTK
ncbi:MULTISPECIES: DUF2092 domain-containing protein [Pseudomonas]|jgi:hypothetical protein|uniref:DUF2092 domain-containing protein n=1 Tax=Pseudomonas TaxID=286 RepID=UPI00062B0C1E|nr:MULTISPECIES: DUF2092 domain-containing protein [Pseudomonas]KKX61955.1 membrane protein [Pseudomonas putida]MCK8659195.1 DUF2092 domain-containing protein [Pseudomonas umsongensis]OMQ30463.1 hypothetical protein BKX96_27110 [Pseudomonas putida]